MTEHIIKLASGLPKEDLNGLDDATLAEALWKAKTEHRDVQPRAVIVLLGVREAKVAKDNTNIVAAEVLRVQPVELVENRRSLERMLAEEYRHQTGAAIPPYEVESVTKAAFIDLPKSTEEIDAQEAEEQDVMSPTDELRRHLERVHGTEGTAGMSAEELESKHTADHDGELGEGLEHSREWFGWTRADLEAAAAEHDGEDGTPTNDEIEGPDPDLGKDLDDEDDQPASLFDDGFSSHPDR